MVRRFRSHCLELHTALRHRLYHLDAIGDGLPDDALQTRELRRPFRLRDPKESVGSERWNHPAADVSITERAVMLEQVGRSVGRREHFDVEPLEKRAWSKLRRLQALCDCVEYR